MSLTLSTGLANKLLDTDSLKTVMTGASGFQIDIYLGSKPATADAAETGTLLVTILQAGSGLHFAAAAASAALAKLGSEVWQSNVVTAGVAGWFRMRPVGDATGLSTTLARIDGTVGTSGADMNLSYVNFVAGAPVAIGTFSLALPQA